MGLALLSYAWQKDPTAGYPSGPSVAGQQGLASLGRAWQKDPTSLGHARQNDLEVRYPFRLSAAGSRCT
jgi:hypothetical protein